MAGYECPDQLRGFEKMFTGFTYQNGLDAYRVFDDLLRYIIQGFTFDIKDVPPLTSWDYTPEQSDVFYDMCSEWIRVMNKQVKDDTDWYDALGELYELLIASKGRRSNAGQFFTPMHLCDLMAKLNGADTPVTGKRVSDPSCGSGRTLIAFHVRNLGNTLYAEDIDRTCAMMCVCNFLIHGCVGEVVWHDSLLPETYYGGWRVNENLRFGFPSVRTMEKEQSYVWRSWQARKAEVAAGLYPPPVEKKEPGTVTKPAPEVVPVRPSTQPVQLRLFD